MKRILLFLIPVFLFAVSARAVSFSVPLYPEFKTATIYMSNHTRTIVPMNYDLGTDKMYYKDGSTVMELSLENKIDSIVWAGDHSFILLNGKFCEKVSLGGKPVLVQWRLKKVSLGKTGALGSVTQSGNVSEMNLSGMGLYGAGPTGSVENYRYTNTNVYFVPTADGVKRVSSLKHLYKYFPDKAEPARQFIRDKALELTRHEDFMRLIAFCLED